jgi:hypothetical protein
LILEESEGVTVNLGRDRGIQYRTVFLQVAKKTLPKGETRFAALSRETAFNVSTRPLERQELDGNIGSAQYVAIAKVTARKEIGLTICVDPTKFDGDPGTYVGRVRIESTVIQPITVPVTATLQYPGYRWVVPVFAVVTFLAGSFVVWASGKKAQKGASTTTEKESVWRDISELPAWILDNYVGVVAGAIAAISVFVAKYWRSPPWGAMAPEDWLALLGSVFTAYTASLTAASALVPPRSRTRAAPGGQAGAGSTGSSPGSSGAKAGDPRGHRPPEGRGDGDPGGPHD